MGDLPRVSLHYWNPTNYKNKLDLVLPIELASPQQYPQKTIEAVDRLCRALLDQWPWEINIKSKLVTPKYKWNHT
jgi:hypothetical protein